MELIKQTNEYECGICCLNMLVNYYYKDDKITKVDLYKKTYISKDGLSIMELEILASKFGIFLDSYDATWQEIINDKNYEPFIILINYDSLLHYVVCTKSNDKLTIYDPKGIIKTIPLNSPINDYANIYIKSSKFSNQCQTKRTETNKINFINIKYVFLICFLTLLLSSIQIFCSFISSKIINKISKNSLFFILSVIFTLIFLYLTNALIQYLIFLIKYKLLYKQYFFLLIKFSNILKLKAPSFYQTIDKNIFNNAYQIFKNNIFWINDFYCQLINNSIFIIISIFLIIIIDIKLLLFIFINILIYLILNIFDYNNLSKYANLNIEFSNKVQNKLISINNFNFNNFNIKLNNHLYYKLNSKHKKYEKNKYQIEKKIIWIDIIKDTWNNIFLILIICAFSTFKIKEIGTLLFSLQIINFSNKNTIQLINVISEFFNFKIIKEILNNLLYLNNLKQDENNKLYLQQDFKLNKNIIIFHEGKINLNDTFLKCPNKIHNNFDINKIIIIKYENLNECILEMLDYINDLDTKNEIENEIINLIIYKKHLKQFIQFDYLLIYLLFLSSQENKNIIIDIEFSINNDNEYYKYLKYLINKILLKNNIYISNKKILEDLNYETLEFNLDEENL